MKTIKKLKAVAGTALLAGATLAGASFAAAQNSGTQHNLGDYPQPYVDEDGNVDASIIVGSSAKAADVVGAIDIAGSLSQAASTTETVSTEGASFGWSATDGVSLDTRNDQLYFGDQLDKVRSTLTEDQLGVLAETTFRDDAGDETDITSYLDVGPKSITYGNSPDGLDDEDPVLHVPVPSESGVTASDYLYNLQANMEDSINFTSSDVKGEDIELFGKSYTVSESDNAIDDTQLVLYGSQDETSIDSGDSSTITVDGTEHTIEVVAVTSSNDVAFRVDGELQERTEDETFTIDGSEVRVTDVIQTSSQNSEGVATFAVGSQELVLPHDGPVQDSDGDDIEGTYVEFNGGTFTDIESVSSIDIYVGSADDDMDYVAAGESFSHDLFDNIEFHFGGLNPDASEADSAEEVTVQKDGDDDATIEFTGEGGDSATVSFVHDSSSADTDDLTSARLQDSDGDEIHVMEEAELTEDEYMVTDAGDFSHMWQVTGIERDVHTDAAGVDNTDIDGDEEAVVDIRDVVTGDTVEVDIPIEDGDYSADPDDANYVGTEIIDGQTYYFEVDGAADTPYVEIAWGEGAMIGEVKDDGFYSPGDEADDYGATNDDGGGGADYGDDGGENGDDIPGAGSLFTALDTENGNAVAFYTPMTANTPAHDYVFEFPSTDSTDASTEVEFDPEQNDDDSGDGDLIYGNDASETDSDGTGWDAVGTMYDPSDGGGDPGAPGTAVNAQDFRVGQLVYTVYHDGNEIEKIGLAADQSDGVDTDGGIITTPSAIVLEQEDEGGDEDAFIVRPDSYSESDGYDFGGGGALSYSDRLNLVSMDSDDNLQADYTSFGTYVEQDTEDEGSVTLNLPQGQSVAGAAFTGSGGELSSGGSAGTVETQTPTGWPDAAALDSEVGTPSQPTILVGGPVVNSLVQELANADETWSAGDYSQGTAIIDQIDDAFGDNDAIVVAGQSAEDTREAATFLANYEQNEDRMAGSDRVELTTAQGTQ